MVTGCLKFTQSIYSWLKQKKFPKWMLMLTQIRNKLMYHFHMVKSCDCVCVGYWKHRDLS